MKLSRKIGKEIVIRKQLDINLIEGKRGKNHLTWYVDMLRRLTDVIVRRGEIITISEIVVREEVGNHRKTIRKDLESIPTWISHQTQY